MKLIVQMLRSSRGAIIISTLTGAAGGIASVALLGMIQAEINRPFPSRARVAWTFGGLAILSAAARFAAQVSMIRLGQESMARLNVRLVGKTLMLPLRDFEKLSVDALLSVLTQDIVLVANALVGVPQMCINVPIVIACFALVGWQSPLFLVCGVTFAALAIAAYLMISGAAGRQLWQARARQDTVVGLYRGLIGGFRELKLHAGRRKSYRSDALEPATQDVRDQTVRGLSLFAAAEGWSQLAFFGFLGFVLFITPTFSPSERGTLSATVLVVLYLMAPLNIIISWMPILGRARASLRRIESLLSELETSELSSGNQQQSNGEVLTMRSAVQLDGAAFAFQSDDEEAGFTLGPIDLELRAGQIVILAGGNGSGKTTLVKLLCGLYWPVEGVLRVDGRVLCEENLEAYRQLFSVVFADGHLFQDLHGLGGPEVERRVRDGLEEMELAGKVAIENGRFSTVDLSQGQKRRLALLAALAEDRPVCILDEWAAHQDTGFKEVFYFGLLPALKAAGKAVLVISHDETYFDVADRVLHLREGRILQEQRRGAKGLWSGPLPQGFSR